MTLEGLCVGFWGRGYWNRLDDGQRQECMLTMKENVGAAIGPLVEQAFRDGATQGDPVFATAYKDRIIGELGGIIQ